jgi:hypothetical protein
MFAIVIYFMDHGERRKRKEDDSASTILQDNICEGRGYKDVLKNGGVGGR